MPHILISGQKVFVNYDTLARMTASGELKPDSCVWLAGRSMICKDVPGVIFSERHSPVIDTSQDELKKSLLSQMQDRYCALLPEDIAALYPCNKSLAYLLNDLVCPASFRFVATELRSIIRNRRKKKLCYDCELTIMYRIAAIWSMNCDHSQRANTQGSDVLFLIPRKQLYSLPYKYSSLGLDKLVLLKTTDKKWIRERFGEPVSHRTLQEENLPLWQHYEDLWKFMICLNSVINQVGSKQEEVYYKKHKEMEQELLNLLSDDDYQQDVKYLIRQQMTPWFV